MEIPRIAITLLELGLLPIDLPTAAFFYALLVGIVVFGLCLPPICLIQIQSFLTL